MKKIKHLLTVLSLTFLSTLSVAQIEMIPLPPQQATFTLWTRGFHFQSPLDMKIISLRVPTTVSSGPQSIAVVKFNAGAPPAFPGNTSNYDELFYVSNDPSMTEIPVDIDLLAGEFYGVYGSRNGANSYGTIGPWMTQIFGENITLSRSGTQTNIATNWPNPIWSEVNFRIGRIEVTCQLGGGGGEEVFCEPSNCLIVECPDDVTVDCFEDYEIDAQNANAIFNCTGQGTGGEEDFSQTINFTNPNLLEDQNFFDFTGFPAGNIVSAELNISGFGDLDGTGSNIERWDVVGENSSTILGSVGGSGNFGDQCNTTFSSGPIALDPATVNNWAADGTISLVGWDAEVLQGTGAGNINVTLCGGDFLEVTLDLTIDTGGGGGPGGPCTEAFRYVTQPHITGAANCPGTTYEVVYKVGDNCGNVGCCVQTITIGDNAPPVVDVEPGFTVGCYEDIPVDTGSDDPNDNQDVDVTTSCGEGFDLKILPPVVDGIHECPGTTYTYAYRVRDNCGREVIAERIFTIGTNASPSIIAPPDMVVTCDYNVNLNPDYAEVVTGCTLGYTTTVSGPSVSGAPNCNGSTYTYTYTVTDDCGRTASDVRTFTIANEAPTFLNCPDVPLQLNCEDEGWEYIIQAWLASVEAESSCSDALTVSNNYNPNTQGLCINNGTKRVRFFATDACGRTSTCEGMIIVADTEAPIFVTPPQDYLTVCNYITQDKLDAWVDNHGGAEVEDCWTINDNNWSTFPNNPTISCDPNMPTSITVTFVATDGCGNKASMDATFTALPTMGGMAGENGDEAADQLQLFQNQPNPFKNETTISFYLPQATKASLSIYDLSGKLLKQIEGDYSEGMNVEEINRSDLQGAGVLYYKLSTATETATLKMILLD